MLSRLRQCHVRVVAELNGSSAKIGRFPVRAYVEKTSGKTKENKNWRCILVGTNPEQYVSALVRGTARAVSAEAKFKAGSAWVLTKTVLDTKSDIRYISGPMKMVVSLSAPTTVAEASAEEEKRLAGSLLPKFSVADSVVINADGMYFDMIGIVKDMSERRPVKDSREACTMTLVDDSSTSAGKVAAIDITLFQDAKANYDIIAEGKKALGKVVIVLSVRSVYSPANTPPLELRSSQNARVIADESSQRAQALMAIASSRLSEDNVEKLAACTIKPTFDWEQPPVLTFANSLSCVAATAATPNIMQLMHVHIYRCAKRRSAPQVWRPHLVCHPNCMM